VTERWTFDFLVDGQSLAGRFGVAERDLVGRLDRADRAANAAAIRVLTGEDPPDLPPDRVILFVCPECGGLGCGAVTAAVRVTDKAVTWSDFLHENSYDESMSTPFPGVGPFEFDADAYRRVLGQTVER
jgi:hypothetical protein